MKRMVIGFGERIFAKFSVPKPLVPKKYLSIPKIPLFV